MSAGSLVAGSIFTVGVYASPSQEGDVKLLEKIKDILKDEPILDIHAFYNYRELKLVTMDIVPEESVKDEDAFVTHITQKLQTLDSQSTFSIIIDHNYVS